MTQHADSSTHSTPTQSLPTQETPIQGAPTQGTRTQDTRTTGMAPLIIDVVSDTICPWCYIGKRRLEKALGLLGDEFSVVVRWQPFELNPHMPRAGISRRDYRIQKFGSWEHSLALDAQVAEAGAGDGLVFHHVRMTRTPNTLASHALVRSASTPDQQYAVIDALFKAYFTEGRDVGEADVLVEIGVACGMAQDTAKAAISDESLRDALKAEAQHYARGGVSGVPSALVDGAVLFTGAQPPELMAAALRQAWAAR